MMRSGDLANTRRDSKNQSIDIAIRSIIPDDFLHYFSPYSFVRRHIDVFGFAKDQNRDSVVEPTAQILPKSLPFFLKVRIDNIITLLKLFVKKWDIRRVVLKIVIHNHYDRAGCIMEACHKGIVL